MMRRSVAAGLGFGIAVAAGAGYIAKRSIIPNAAPRTVEAPQKALRAARVVLPEPVDALGRLTLTGRTAPVEQALVSTRASGIVAERRADIGDRVNEGDILVTIDAPEIAQELDRAKAATQQAKARLELAKVNLDRADTLVGKGYTSEQVRDERRATARTAEADVAAAEAEVRRLDEVIRFQTVRAPFSGTIVERRVERGDKVMGTQTQGQTYLFRIASIDELRVEIDVPQAATLKVRKGTAAKVAFAELPGETFEARVARSSGFVEQTSSTMRVELLMTNPGRRIPAGLSGQVILDITQGEGVVSVPANTLSVRDGRQAVAVAGADGTVSFRPVMVGRDLGERVEIIAGLTANDRVILSPNALLKPGDKVDVTTATADKGGPTKTK